MSLLDHDGRTLWSYDPEFGANDMAAGDLDNDGRLDFVVGCNGSGGIHRLDLKGKQLWSRPDANVWHVEIVDADGDGNNEILHTSMAAQVKWRDARGAVVKDQKAEDPGLGDFSLFRSPSGEQLMLFYSPKSQEIVLTSLDGRPHSRFDAPIPASTSVYGVWAASADLGQSGSPLMVAVLWLRQPYKSKVERS